MASGQKLSDQRKNRIGIIELIFLLNLVLSAMAPLTRAVVADLPIIFEEYDVDDRIVATDADCWFDA